MSEEKERRTNQLLRGTVAASSTSANSSTRSNSTSTSLISIK